MHMPDVDARVDTRVERGDWEAPRLRLASWPTRLSAQAETHIVTPLAQALREVDDMTPYSSQAGAGHDE